MLGTYTLPSLKKEQETRYARQRRRRIDAEAKAMMSATGIVFSGLFMAFVYALLTQRIAV